MPRRKDASVAVCKYFMTMSVRLWRENISDRTSCVPAYRYMKVLVIFSKNICRRGNFVRFLYNYNYPASQLPQIIYNSTMKSMQILNMQLSIMYLAVQST